MNKVSLAGRSTVAIRTVAEQGVSGMTYSLRCFECLWGTTIDRGTWAEALEAGISHEREHIGSRESAWTVAYEWCGNGPCATCGTFDNPVWFTENALWNEVVRTDLTRWGGIDPILCIPCFVQLAEPRIGMSRWRLVPEAKEQP